ncbi:hypothetical protein LINPERPRIM_LOCUS11683 [Linum perenne]
MGRGKGNPTSWIARVSTGQIFVAHQTLSYFQFGN